VADQQRAQDRKQDQKKERATTGQGQRDQGQREQGQRDQSQRDQNRQRQETQQNKDQQQQDQRAQDRSPQQQQGGQANMQSDAQGRVTLNNQQRTRIQQTVLASSDVPRVRNVDFAVRVGTVVPSHVHFVDVPPALIEINPAWRGHKYVVVEEEIIILTPERRIVAVVPVGRGHASGSSTSATVVELPPDEIRILQQVLVDRGFSVEVDGVFGPRTREALISFQRREGLQATGQIDARTVTALGAQGRINVSGEAQQGTTGSGQSSQQPGAQQQGQQQQGQQPDTNRSQQGTTGSGSGQQSQEPAQPQQGTTGSGGSEQPQGSEMKRQPDAGKQQAPGGRNSTPQNRPAQSPSGSKY
jgi:hypothetical protein